MRNGEWDSNILGTLEPQGDYLLVAPASALIGYASWQWLDKGLISGVQAMAREFRAQVGKSLYVAEAFRSIETQRSYFFGRYTKVSYWTGLEYEGSYWVKKPGEASAALPGTSKHGDGFAMDVWSGVNYAFDSPEHVAFEAIAKTYGWVNTGRNFGEPWHFEFKPGTATAGTGISIPVEEDDMYSDDDRNRDVATRKDLGTLSNTVTMLSRKVDDLTAVLATVDDRDDASRKDLTARVMPALKSIAAKIGATVTW